MLFSALRRAGRYGLRILGAGAALALVACTSTDPRPALQGAADLAAARGLAAPALDLEAPRDAALAPELRARLDAPLDAEGAAAVALAHNPGLRAELARLGVAQANLAQAARLAELTLGGSWLRGDGETKSSLLASWDLLDVLVLPLRKRLAAAAVEQAKLEAGQAMLDLAAAARSAMLRYQASVEVAAHLARAEDAERAGALFAQALHEAGNLGELGAVQATATWTERRAARIAADAAAQAAREAVTRLLGLREDAPWTAAPLPPVPADASAESPAEGGALDRLDLRAARWGVDALEAALRAKRRTRFLPLSLEVGVERERETDGVRVTGPSLAVRLPLFDLGRASLARLEAERREARWQLESRTVAALSEARVARAELGAARAREALVRGELLPARTRALDLVLRRYNMMLSGAPDVLLAKQAELDAARAATEARRDYWLARVALARALGTAPSRTDRSPEGSR